MSSTEKGKKSATCSLSPPAAWGLLASLLRLLTLSNANRKEMGLGGGAVFPKLWHKKSYCFCLGFLKHCLVAPSTYVRSQTVLQEIMFGVADAETTGKRRVTRDWSSSYPWQGNRCKQVILDPTAQPSHRLNTMVLGATWNRGIIQLSPVWIPDQPSYEIKFK